MPVEGGDDCWAAARRKSMPSMIIVVDWGLADVDWMAVVMALERWWRERVGRGMVEKLESVLVSLDSAAARARPSM